MTWPLLKTARQFKAPEIRKSIAAMIDTALNEHVEETPK